MAGKQLALEVVTPDQAPLAVTCDFVVVTTTSGEMGFLPDHAPLVAALVPHVLRYTIDGQEDHLFVSGGLVEVRDNVVSVLTNAAETSSEIDFARAEEARQRALAQLAKREHVDEARAHAALARANARLSMQGKEQIHHPHRVPKIRKPEED